MSGFGNPDNGTLPNNNITLSLLLSDFYMF